MKVEWEVSDKYPFLDAHIVWDLRASIMRVNDLWMASLYDARGCPGYPTKSDPSLIELMNWVEEELKFRMSHEQS